MKPIQFCCEDLEVLIFDICLQVLVTEVSGPMVRSLKEKGFPVLSAPDLSGLQAPWNAVIGWKNFPSHFGIPIIWL